MFTRLISLIGDDNLKKISQEQMVGLILTTEHSIMAMENYHGMEVIST